MTFANWLLVAGTLAGMLTVGCSAVSHSASGGYDAGTLKATNPRVEYRAQPLGIGETQPRFSWTLTPKDTAARGQRQSAYQLRVTSNDAEVWNSGKTASDATAQVV